MIWLYERDSETLRLETRFDNDAHQYVLTVHRASGVEVERYERLEDFRQRLLALEKLLAGEHWQRSGPPVIDPEGWPTDRPN